MKQAILLLTAAAAALAGALLYSIVKSQLDEALVQATMYWTLLAGAVICALMILFVIYTSTVPYALLNKRSPSP